MNGGQEIGTDNLDYVPPLTWLGPTPDDRVLEQAHNAQAHPNVVGVALMADNHLGYAVPIGSVVAYRDAVSPSGVVMADARTHDPWKD